MIDEEPNHKEPDRLLIKWIKLHINVIVLGIALILIVLDVFLPNQVRGLELKNYLTLISFVLVGVILLNRFWKFYSGDERLDHHFTSFHGSTFLSGFYRIFFPAFIVGFVIQFIVLFALLPESLDGWGILNQPEISPSGSLVFIVGGLTIGIVVMVLADLEMRKNNLLFSPRSKNSSYWKGLMYMIPLLGLYFGLISLVRFLIEINLGKGVLIPATADFFSVDSGIIQAARFWIFLSAFEKRLVLISFVVVYIALEYMLRGYLGNQGRRTNLGPGGMVFVPAIIQAFGFSSTSLMFSNPEYYWFTIFKGLILGLVLGIVLWRTGRFSVTIIMALLARALDNTIEFHVTLLRMLPEVFGLYDPADGIVTQADEFGFFLLYAQVVLIILAPFIVIISYHETLTIITQLGHSLRNQWFGYFILAGAFLLIDLVFSLMTQWFNNPFFSFMAAILVIGFLLSYLFKVLPPPGDMDLLSFTDAFGGEFPLDVLSDIKYLESTTAWYEKPTRLAILGGLVYLYILFITAAYKQISFFNSKAEASTELLIEDLTFTLFLIILPTLLIVISVYLVSRSLKDGYFFAETWRKSFYGFLSILLIYTIYNWSVSSSIANFSWRNVPLFIAFAVLIWPKTIHNPVKEYSTGMARDGRYSTFRHVLVDPTMFTENYVNLAQLDSEIVHVGSKILAAKLDILDHEDEINLLKENSDDKAMNIGSIFALGIMESANAESLILQFLSNEDVDIKLASFWALGKIGTTRSLERMTLVLEENPLKSLIKVAENAILTIDPLYPLAGLRDHIVLD